jgi:hypothetical protein
MANIFVRSPFYVSKKDNGGTAAYGILTIQVDGTTVYTLRKNISQTYVLFEIAELLRDYLNIGYALMQTFTRHIAKHTKQAFSFTQVLMLP